jgi:hypothetical protein
MGMIIYFHAASDETIRNLLADPPKVFALLDDDSDQALAAELKLAVPAEKAAPSTSTRHGMPSTFS